MPVNVEESCPCGKVPQVPLFQIQFSSFKMCRFFNCKSLSYYFYNNLKYLVYHVLQMLLLFLVLCTPALSCSFCFVPPVGFPRVVYPSQVLC